MCFAYVGIGIARANDKTTSVAQVGQRGKGKITSGRRVGCVCRMCRRAGLSST